MKFPRLKKLLLLFFSCLSFSLNGRNLDSLYNLLPQYVGTDKVDLLIDLAHLELPKKGIELALTAEVLSQELADANGLKDAWEILSACYAEVGNFDKATYYIEKMLEANQTEVDIVEKVNTYFSAIYVYGMIGEERKELDGIYDALLLASKVDDKELIAFGKFRLASFLHRSLGDNEKALEVGMRSYSYYKEVNEPSLLSAIAYVLSKTHSELGDFQKAEIFIQEAITLTRQESDKNSLRSYTGALADLFILQQMYEKAIPYLDESMALCMEVGDPVEIAINKLAYADIALNTEREKEGVLLAKEGIAILEPLNKYEEMEAGYQLLQDYYQKVKDVENELYCANKLRIIQDSMDVLGLAHKAVDLEISRLAKENEAKLKRINSTNTFQRYLFVVILILLLIGGYFYRRHSLQKEQIKEIKLKEVKAKQQAQLLEVEKLKKEKRIDLQEKKDLEVQLALHKKTLTSNSLLLSKKEELLANVHEDLKAIRSNVDAPVKNKLITVSNLLERHRNNNHNWESFRLQFEQIHPDFIKNLLGHTASLNNNDIRFASYLKLNLSTTEIAEIMGVAPSSIHKARYRLKKKMTLKKGDDLHQFLREL